VKMGERKKGRRRRYGGLSNMARKKGERS